MCVCTGEIEWTRRLLLCYVPHYAGTWHLIWIVSQYWLWFEANVCMIIFSIIHLYSFLAKTMSMNMSSNYFFVSFFKECPSPCHSCSCLPVVLSRGHYLLPFTTGSCYRVYFVVMVIRAGSPDAHIVPENYSAYDAKWVTCKQSDNICLQFIPPRKISYFKIIWYTHHPSFDWLGPRIHGWSIKLFKSINNKSALGMSISLCR